MTNRRWRAYPAVVNPDGPTCATDAAPTSASLERERSRQRAEMRPMRAVGLLAVALVLLAGVLTAPRPGLTGQSLGVLLALCAVAAGFVGGTVAVVRLSLWRQSPFYLLLIGGSAALIWLQPAGAGILGCYVAAFSGSFRLRPRPGAVVGLCTLAALIIAEVGAISYQSRTDLLIECSGLAAFYAMGWMVRRLREGQDQALRLALELEESHLAKAEALALAERQRLARDMHDVLAHSLSGLVLQLEGARLLAERENAAGDLTAVVDRALHLGRAGLAEARRAIGALRDEELPGPELVPTLVSDFERDAGVPCSLDIDGIGRPLDSVARLTVYRVTQEALTNIRRHAHPDRVSVRLAYEPQGVRLTVEDAEPAGRAQEPSDGDDGASGGYGITGMRERAELLGGHLHASPTGAGFRVELWLPG
jgi:signal transduction histidine kinase